MVATIASGATVSPSIAAPALGTDRAPTTSRQQEPSSDELDQLDEQGGRFRQRKTFKREDRDVPQKRSKSVRKSRPDYSQDEDWLG